MMTKQLIFRQLPLFVKDCMAAFAKSNQILVVFVSSSIISLVMDVQAYSASIADLAAILISSHDSVSRCLPFRGLEILSIRHSMKFLFALFSCFLSYSIFFLLFFTLHFLTGRTFSMVTLHTYI